VPFKSKAQQGYMHAHPEILGKAGLAEWDSATKGKHLPEKKSKGPKHGMHRTEIEHHHDGSHTVTHHMHGKSEPMSSAHANDADMMEHMDGALGSAAPAAPPAEPGGAPMPPAQ
jgi:hypothetical protein